VSDLVRLEFTHDYLAEISSLPARQRIRIADRLTHLPVKGWSAAVRDRDVAPLRDGIWEVRVLGKGAAYRILFFVHPGSPGRLMVLTTCMAKASIKKPRVMDAAIERARTRREKWLSEQERKDET
jgi:putative component of toxin-antitoxin plasmid stabilization module